MSSIWPQDLDRRIAVPACLLGHTLVLAERRRELPRVVHAEPRPERRTAAAGRIDSALDAMGLAPGDRYRSQDGFQAANAEPSPGRDHTFAIATPATRGEVSVFVHPQGNVVVTFKSVARQDNPRNGCRFDALVDDPTLHQLDPNGEDEPRQRWSLADRDRWLAWVGFTPA